MLGVHSPLCIILVFRSSLGSLWQPKQYGGGMCLWTCLLNTDGNMLICFLVSERLNGKDRLSMKIQYFQASFLQDALFTAVTWQGATVCWGTQMILSTDFSLLKNSLCSLCTSLAAGEPDCVFVQWSAWYRAGASLCLSVVPLLKRTENYCPQVSAVLLLFCCRPWPRCCVCLNR